MKRDKRRRAQARGRQKTNGAPVADRRIVQVDDGPLRARAGRECSRAMEKLENARGELRRFEQEDHPAFERWMAATFGALLTEIRENARVIAEKECLVEEVKMEMAWGNHRNPRRAYAAVMKERRRRGAEEDFAQAGGHGGRWEEGEDDWSEEEEEAFAGEDFEVSDAERRALFDDFVSTVLGMDPKRIPKEDYAGMFAAFEKELFGDRPHANPAPARSEARPGADTRADGKAGRIKELYRTLVRRLHPDLRSDGDATVSAIWHEVQEAYEAQNIERLETLLALTEVQAGADGGQATLFQMRAAMAEFNRAFQVIQRSISEAKRDPAWAFSRTPYHGPLEKRIRREIDEDLADQRWILADLERRLADWSQPWQPPAKKTRKQPGPPVKSGTARASNIPRPVQQELFAF